METMCLIACFFLWVATYSRIVVDASTTPIGKVLNTVNEVCVSNLKGHLQFGLLWGAAERYTVPLHRWSFLLISCAKGDIVAAEGGGSCPSLNSCWKRFAAVLCSRRGLSEAAVCQSHCLCVGPGSCLWPGGAVATHRCTYPIRV